VGEPEPVPAAPQETGTVADAAHLATLAFDAVGEASTGAGAADADDGEPTGTGADPADADAGGDRPTDERLRRARVVADAVGVEVGGIDDDRSRATVRREGRTVIVEIEADDLIALRAACNTWTRLVGVAEAACALGAGRGPGSATGDPGGPGPDPDPDPSDADSGTGSSTSGSGE
jgi:KEOPS complex subunit Pcc1